MTRRRKWITVIVGCVLTLFVVGMVTTAWVDGQFGNLDFQVR